MKVHTTIQGERNATDSTQEFYAGRSRFGSRTGIVEGELEDRIAHGKRDKPAIHTVSDEEAPKRLAHAATVIEEAKQKWQLDQHIHVAVVYEAGQSRVGRIFCPRGQIQRGQKILPILPDLVRVTALFVT